MRYSYCSDYTCIVRTCLFLILEKSNKGRHTKYYSPLNNSCFGCCGFSTEKLDAFVYDEGKGGKGENNVSSLL